MISGISDIFAAAPDDIPMTAAEIVRDAEMDALRTMDLELQVILTEARVNLTPKFNQSAVIASLRIKTL